MKPAIPPLLFRPPHGFSIAEVAIVLVILGLLIGGVLTGQALVRESQLKAITSEREKYATAIFTFRDRYHALPGDLTNAHHFWGMPCGEDSDEESIGCNGNGDGKIDPFDEDFKAWKHLAHGGLIVGSYDGILSEDGGPTPTNVPKSKYPKAYWVAHHYAENAMGIDDPDDDSNLILKIGGMAPPGDVNLLNDIDLKHSEAWDIDLKIDDGRANTGQVRGDANSECFDVNDDHYNLRNGGADTDDCMLNFILN